MSNNLKEQEAFVFNDTLSELTLEPKTEKQIEQQLFKGFDPEKIVDAYEDQLGIKPAEQPKSKIKYKNVMLSPGTDDDDSDLYNQLLNDPELYQIVEKTAYWTPRGEYKVFVVYGENLDVKKEREKSKGTVQ